MSVGRHGVITAKLVAPKQWRARVYVRDADGHRREVSRWATTKTGAIDAVQEALDDRPGFGESPIDADTRVTVVAELWFAGIERDVKDGLKSSDTARTYRSTLDQHIIPAVGALRCREADTPRLEAFLVAKHEAGVSATQRKTIKSVLSGVMGTAVRHGALPTNPVRDVSRVVAVAKKSPRSLTAEETVKWLEFLEVDRSARAHDLYDLTVLMLATGCRISEMLAVRTQDVDPEQATIGITHRVKRVKGEGLVRVERSDRSSKGKATTLRLPDWAVRVCRRRILALGGDGPLLPTAAGNWRDPVTTAHALQRARENEKVGMPWLTSHMFRKTVATLLDEGGLSARLIADQLTHSKPSMTLDKYMGRGVVGDAAAKVLERHDPTKSRRVSGE